MPAHLQMKRPAALVMKKPAKCSMKKPAASAKSSVKRPAVATRKPSKATTASSSELIDDGTSSCHEAHMNGGSTYDIHGDPQEVAAEPVAPEEEPCLLMVHVPDLFPGFLPDVPDNHEPSQDALENAPCGWLREWGFLTQPQRVYLINRPDGIFQAS